MHRRSPGLHHRAAVRLLVVARADHEDLALEPEQRAGERERRAPLARAGLRRELAHAGLGVLVRPPGPGRVPAAGLRPPAWAFSYACATAVFGLCEPAGETPSYL